MGHKKSKKHHQKCNPTVIVVGGKDKCHSDSSSECSSESSHKPKVSPNWPSMGRNLKNWRNAPAEKILSPKTVENLQSKWEFGGLSEVTQVSAVDGVLYGTDLRGRAFALDAVTGTPIWGPIALVPDGESIFLAPAVGKTTVYVCSVANHLFALNRATGAVIPPYPVNINTNPSSPLSLFFSSVVLVEEEDLLFLATGGALAAPAPQFGTVRAFQASTGVQLWAYQTTLNATPGQPNSGGPGVGIFGTPAIDRENGLLIVGTGQNYSGAVTPISDSLIALDYRHGGTLVWFHQFTNDDVGKYSANDCYYTNGPIKDWDADGGPILLSRKTHCGKQLIAVVGDKKGNIYALDRLNGTLLWTTTLTNPNPSGSVNGGVNSLPCTDGEIVYCPSIYSTDGVVLTNGKGNPNIGLAIFAVRASDGHILWRKDFPQNGGLLGAVTYANGVVYFVAGGFNDDPNPIIVPTTFFALDAKNGETLFQFQKQNATGIGSVTIYKGMAYFGFGGNLRTRPGGVQALGL